jgi:hypothetical protein
MLMSIYPFLLLVFGAAADRTQAGTPIDAQSRGIQCQQKRGSVAVVTDGGAGMQGHDADRQGGHFEPAPGSCQAVRVLRFDAEPASAAEVSVEGMNADLVVLRPRTPMREAIVSGIEWLKDMPEPHTMIVIAHEQFYPTAVSADDLVKLAYDTQTTIHTVHIASRQRSGGILRRLGRALKDSSTRLAEATEEDEHSDSSFSTARLLKRLAGATGGHACAAADGVGEAACQDSIASATGNSERRSPAARERTPERDCPAQEQ